MPLEGELVGEVWFQDLTSRLVGGQGGSPGEVWHPRRALRGGLTPGDTCARPPTAVSSWAAAGMAVWQGCALATRAPEVSVAPLVRGGPGVVGKTCARDRIRPSWKKQQPA